MISQWTIESRVPDTDAGALFDADVGFEPAITITRVSDGQIMTAGSPMVRVGLGTYSYVLLTAVAGVLYRGDATWRVQGSARQKIIEQVGPGTADWYYSGQAAFDLFQGAPATTAETDVDDDANRNLDVLVAAGVRGDDYIDSKLNGMGWTVPLTGMDSRTTRRLEDMSNHAARWQLAESKNWALFIRANSAADAANAGLTDKKYVDEWLDAVRNGDETIVADGGPVESGGNEGGFEAVDIVDSSERFITDENGNVIAPLEWWP
jgi:hypothetical protein